MEARCGRGRAGAGAGRMHHRMSAVMLRPATSSCRQARAEAGPGQIYSSVWSPGHFISSLDNTDPAACPPLSPLTVTINYHYSQDMSRRKCSQLRTLLCKGQKIDILHYLCSLFWERWPEIQREMIT